MSKLIANKTAEVNQILEVLKTCAVSSNDYVSSHEPFFKNDSASQPFQQYNMLYVIILYYIVPSVTLYNIELYHIT